MTSIVDELIALHPAFATGRLSWDQFGGCTQSQLDKLAEKWFPGDIEKAILIQDLWNRHPKRQQGNTSIIYSHSSFFALYLSFPVYYHLVFSHIYDHALSMFMALISLLFRF
jgi:hypothetical protein